MPIELRSQSGWYSGLPVESDETGSIRTMILHLLLMLAGAACRIAKQRRQRPSAL